MLKHHEFSTHEREPRSRLIGRFIEHWLQGTVAKQVAYADDVRACYWAQLPDADDRAIEFHPVQGERDLKANRQLVMRMVRGVDVRMPVDMEEALVEALPDGPQRELKRMLAARYGLLAVPMPCGSIGSAKLSRLIKEFGDAVASYGPLLDDGVIDENDSKDLLDGAIGETEDLLGAAAAFLEELRLARSKVA